MGDVEATQDGQQTHGAMGWNRCGLWRCTTIDLYMQPHLFARLGHRCQILGVGEGAARCHGAVFYGHLRKFSRKFLRREALQTSPNRGVVSIDYLRRLNRTQ